MLRKKTRELMDKIDEFLDITIKESMTSWSSLCNIDESSLKMIKASNELFEETKDYTESFAEEFDDMKNQIRETKEDIKDLKRLLEMMKIMINNKLDRMDQE